jgi:hypothetical protein
VSRWANAYPAASGTNATYSRVAHLPVQIEHCELLPLARDTSSGFTKISIVVRLTGDGHEGQGEDLTWDQIDQIEQLRRARELSWLRGTRTVEEFSTLLGLADLCASERSHSPAGDPDQAAIRRSTWATLTRRWVDSRPACGPQ